MRDHYRGAELPLSDPELAKRLRAPAPYERTKVLGANDFSVPTPGPGNPLPPPVWPRVVEVEPLK